jgi:diguanylate cyclase (GGDEF)-like protein
MGILEPKLIENIYQQINIKILVSIGIAFYLEDGTTLEELTKVADHQMYKIKNSKKNIYLEPNINAPI